MQESLVRFLDWEDPLEEGVATHPSIFAWKSPWTKEPGGAESDTTEQLNPHIQYPAGIPLAQLLWSCQRAGELRTSERCLGDRGLASRLSQGEKQCLNIYFRGKKQKHRKFTWQEK